MTALKLSLVAVTVAGAMHAQSRSPEIVGIESEFVHRTFVTKVPIGITYVYYNERFGRQLQRDVQTQVRGLGNVAYVTGSRELDPTNWAQVSSSQSFIINPGEMVRPAACDWVAGQLLRSSCKNYAVPVGGSVTVDRWRWGNDRVTLELSVGLGLPSLVFIFEKDFQRAATKDVMFQAISHALVLDKFEQLQKAEAEYRDLKRQLETARLGYASAGPDRKLGAAEELVRALTALSQNRSMHEKSERGPGVGEAAALGQEVRELEPVVRRLRAEELERVERARVDETRQRVSALDTELAEIDRKIEAILGPMQSKKVGTLAVWREIDAGLNVVAQLFEQAAARRAERAAIGTPAQGAGDQLRAQHALAETLRATLDSQRPVIERLQTADEYKAMQLKLTGERERYTLAFGTASFPAASARYIGLLEQMRENRAQAVKLGVLAAKAQGAALLQEIEQAKRRIRKLSSA